MRAQDASSYPLFGSFSLFTLLTPSIFNTTQQAEDAGRSGFKGGSSWPIVLLSVLSAPAWIGGCTCVSCISYLAPGTNKVTSQTGGCEIGNGAERV